MEGRLRLLKLMGISIAFRLHDAIFSELCNVIITIRGSEHLLVPIVFYTHRQFLDNWKNSS